MPVNIFCCYAHKDEALLNKLKTHLSSLQREGLIEIWHDRDISAGTEWEREISEHLNTAQVILLLVSPDFMNSDYCYGIEMQRALERHERGEACVIPVILEYVYWQIAPLNELQALPKDGQPVTSWSNRDKAFLDITRGIRKAIKELGKPTLVTSEYASRKSISRDTRGYPHIVHCPYRGLFAFQEEDEPFFFGRETFTQQLVNFVHQKLFVAVIGSSGSGKSSAVFAGLIPHLRREGSWLITSLRPGERPFHSLALSLMPLLEPQMSERERLLEGNELGQQLQESRLTLRDIVELIIQKQLGRRFLLVIDQFEELFTLCHEPEVREHFLDELAFIVQPTSKFAFSNFSLLLTLRVDFLGQVLDLHRPIADALQSSNLLLATMNAQELQDTIRKPAEALNMKIEEGLTERILQEVKPASNQLPLLEFALTLLWNKQKGGRLTHAGYVEIGGVEKALADHAEQVFTELSGDEQIQAQQVFIQLVYFGEGTENTRRLATRSEIGEENWKLVIHLSGAHARLVVNGRDQISGEETVEVVHEALISGWQRLREWIENNREFRTWQERLRAAIRLWEKSNRDDGALLRGFLLREAISWMAQDGENLSQKERTFIERSQQTFIERSQQAFIENSQQNEKRLSVLQRISGFSISIMNLDQTLEIIANAIAEELHTDLCSIFFYNELQRMLTLQATNGPRPLSGMPFTQRLGEGYSGWVADKGRPLRVFDALADPHFATEARTYSSEYHGLMSIPIIFFGNTERLIGVISV